MRDPLIAPRLQRRFGSLFHPSWFKLALVLFGIVLPAMLVAWSAQSAESWRSDFLLAIAGMMVSVLLSVTIIDWILGRRLDARWQPVSEFAEQRMNGIANRVITAAMSAYNLVDTDELPEDYSDPTVLKITEDRLMFASGQLLNQIDQLTLGVGPESWQYYYSDLGKISDDIDRLLMVMGDRMEPVAQRRLLRLSQHIATLRMWLEIYRGALGVPHELRTPNAKYAPGEVDEMMKFYVGDQVKTTVKYSIGLLRDNIAAGIVPRVLTDY